MKKIEHLRFSKSSHLSKMAPTPALWALLRWTCSPVASRIPSLMAIERCENDAIRSSFQPAADTHREIDDVVQGESRGPRKKKRRRGEYIYIYIKKNGPKVHTTIKQNQSDKARKENGGAGA